MLHKYEVVFLLVPPTAGKCRERKGGGKVCIFIQLGQAESGVLVSLMTALTLYNQRVPDKCAFLVESLSVSSDWVLWTGQEKKEG